MLDCRPPGMNTPHTSGLWDEGRSAGLQLGNVNQIPKKEPVRKTLFDADIFGLFVQPGEIIEVRAMGINGKKAMILSGYFDDHAAFCKTVRDIDRQQHSGIYFTLQVIDPRLIARAHNRIRQSDQATSDKEVIAYRWLYIDFDPVRPSGISSSDSELRAAMDLREPVSEWIMQEFGLLSPIRAMSGNGGHLLFRLPDILANYQTKPVIEGMIKEVAAKFSTSQVSIDTSVFKPAQLCKLYGTTACKGDEIPANAYREARPHRAAYIDDLGDNHV